MLSAVDSPSQVSVKHRAADPEKSLFILFKSSSSSILLGRERTFARCNDGSGVRNPRSRSLTSAPARFPRLRLLQAPQRAAAPPTKASKNYSGCVKTGEKVCGVDCRIFSRSSLLKVIGKGVLKTAFVVISMATN